jgi:hypothetical protein
MWLQTGAFLFGTLSIMPTSRLYGKLGAQWQRGKLAACVDTSGRQFTIQCSQSKILQEK